MEFQNNCIKDNADRWFSRLGSDGQKKIAIKYGYYDRPYKGLLSDEIVRVYKLEHGL